MRILCTIGDCNGIGLEVWAKALLALEGHRALRGVRLSLIAHPRTVAEYFRALAFPVRVEQTAVEVGSFRVELLPCPTYAPIRWGTPDPTAARQAWEALDSARQLLYQRAADAVVTLPITKHTLRQLGWRFPGQTEFFADPVEHSPMMLFVAGTLRIALATTHLPLCQVPDALTPEVLRRTVVDLSRSLQHDFRIATPRIAVLGINPHAGEAGTLGTEELQLHPVLEQLRAEGYCAEGPFAADAFFARRRWRQYDAVLAAYHDQGLIPFKLLAPTRGVNITLGLPFVRTSPAHGTAYDIAGHGRANPESMRRALLMAIRLARYRICHQSVVYHSRG
ncbi:4-hydroxythreonine-4-phosphate dehydrogenase [bacterium HR21]|nr:4-hydroxythreonine-4-phosphate dehydrogenase [bacterium HR21]